MSLAFIFRIHSAGWLYLLLSLFEWTTNTFWGTDHWSVLDQIVCGLVSWWKLVLVNNRTTGFESMHYYSPIQYMSSVYMYVSIIIFFSFYLGCLVCIRISYCAGQNAKIFFPVFHSAAHIHLNSFFFFFFISLCLWKLQSPSHLPTSETNGGTSKCVLSSLPRSSFLLTHYSGAHSRSQPAAHQRSPSYCAWLLCFLVKRAQKQWDFKWNYIGVCACVCVRVCKAQRKTPYATSKNTMCSVYWVTGKLTSKTACWRWAMLSSSSLTSIAHMCFQWLVICALVSYSYIYIALSLSQHSLLYWALHYQLLMPQCTVLITASEWSQNLLPQSTVWALINIVK